MELTTNLSSSSPVGVADIFLSSTPHLLTTRRGELSNSNQTKQKRKGQTNKETNKTNERGADRKASYSPLLLLVVM